MEFIYSTKGHNDIIDITPDLQKAVEKSGVGQGLLNVFAPGSTVGLTMIEYEPGLQQDLSTLLERMAPVDADYAHNKTWGDGNGYAHLRSALLPPSLTVPIQGGELALGTWQHVVLIDFDNRSRQRKVVVTVLKV